MNIELTEHLYAEFPQLYIAHTHPIEESSMRWGFQCDDGWYELIRSLSRQLTEYADTHPDSIVEVSEVKEKFGWLKFHLTEADENTKKIIEHACMRSRTTCELTGQSGILCVKDSDKTQSRGSRYKVLSSAKAVELGFIQVTSAIAGSDN